MGRKKTDEERQDAADKWRRRLDPAGANRQASLLDTGDSRTGRLREAQRDYDTIRLLDELLEEQRETNRLLKRLVGDDPMPPPDV